MAEDWKLIRKFKLEDVKKRLDEINKYNETLITEAPGDPNGQIDEPENGVMPGVNDQMGDPSQAGTQGTQNDQMGDPSQAGTQGTQNDQIGDPTQAGTLGAQNDQMGDPAQAGTPGTPNDQIGGQEQGVMPGSDETEENDDDLPDEEGDEDEIETDEMEEDDEVIDVDDLTTSQEETEREIGLVNKNMMTLLKVVKQCIKAISDNDKKLEDLMAEYERRNPTEDEKTNIRIKQSGPFNNTPDDFWEKKGESIYDDNMIDPRHDTEYVITFDDVTNFSDKDVSDSITKYPSKLKDYLKF